MAIEGGGEEGFQRRQDWEVAVLTEMADTYDTHTKLQKKKSSITTSALAQPPPIVLPPVLFLLKGLDFSVSLPVFLFNNLKKSHNRHTEAAP